MFFQIVLRIFLSNAQCVPITCQNTFDPYYRCIEVTSSIKVSGCPAGMFCPSYSDISSYNQSLDFLDTYCEPNPYQDPVDLCTNSSYLYTQAVGEDCCINSNCASNLCQNLKCIGLAQNSTCNSTSACAPGLFCNSSICTSALGSGSKCSSDEVCGIGFGCNHGYCVQLWTVPFTKATSDPKFCSSNFMFGDHCDRINIKLNGTKDLAAPFNCSLYDQCTYMSAAYEQVIYSTSCLCDVIQNSTTGYCGLFINQVQGMFENLYLGMQYLTSGCSGEKSHSSNPYDLWQCGSISSDMYQQYVIANKRYSNWNLYMSGVLNQCANTITIFEVGFGKIITLLIWLIVGVMV